MAFLEGPRSLARNFVFTKGWTRRTMGKELNWAGRALQGAGEFGERHPRLSALAKFAGFGGPAALPIYLRSQIWATAPDIRWEIFGGDVLALALEVVPLMTLLAVRSAMRVDVKRGEKILGPSQFTRVKDGDANGGGATATTAAAGGATVVGPELHLNFPDFGGLRDYIDRTSAARIRRELPQLFDWLVSKGLNLGDSDALLASLAGKPGDTLQEDLSAEIARMLRESGKADELTAFTAKKT